MIYYLATRAHLYTIEAHLEYWGRSLSDVVAPLAYEDLFEMLAEDSWWESVRDSWWPVKPKQLRAGGTLPSGTYVFTDMDRLATWDVTRAAIAWRVLTETGDCVRTLNHPNRSMGRYELLRTLYERGINTFNVYRLTEARWPEKYPVFIRGEKDHRGPTLPLLYSWDEIEDTIELLDRESKSRDDLIMIEFCDTVDSIGIYRRYGAFVINDTVIPKNIYFSDEWAIKEPILSDDTLLAEQDEYLATNPHKEQLIEIFKLARIQYGRMDYAILNGAVQVWEINTNPIITGPPRNRSLARQRSHTHMAREFEAALRQYAGLD